MGLFRRPRVDPEEFERIKDQLRFMREHWDAAAKRRDEDARRLDDLGARLEQTSAAEAPGAGVDELRSRIDTLDERVTSVSTELANQLTELGNEIEKLGGSTPAGGGVDETHLDVLRTSQERLANEQARYQIAFREDLARLAEQLRKAAPR